MIKPEVKQVVRLQTYSQLGNSDLMEPVYSVRIEPLIRVNAALGIRGIDSSFTIKKGTERLETQNAWAEFRVKKDDGRGDYYIDVLVGNKDETNNHSHIGINLDQSTSFVESRGVLNILRREIDSRQKGRLADETIEYSERKDGKPEIKFIFQMIIDEPTKTITPKFEEAQLTEKNKRQSMIPVD